jgi:hypothetical protein
VSFLVKEIENNHVVWFEKSNQWLVFDEPQWFIFLLYQKGLDEETAAGIFKHHFQSSDPEPAGFVSNIYNSIYNLLDPDFPLPDFAIRSEEARKYKLTEKRTFHYSYNGKHFSITYGTPSLKNYFHIPLAHLESEKPGKTDFHGEVFPFHDRFALRIKRGECFTANESSQIKRLLYIELASLFYGVKKDQWLTLMHASAVRKGKETLVLSSASGSGKSTMASLLYAQGCKFISDDFVPVEWPGKRAYPFPAAICMKGEVPAVVSGYFPQLEQNSSSGAQYIYPVIKGPIAWGQIRKIVFIRYLPGEQNQFKPLPILEALKLYLQESWVTSNPGQVEDFLNWFTGLEFFEFVYSDEEKAVATVMDLFGKR